MGHRSHLARVLYAGAFTTLLALGCQKDDAKAAQAEKGKEPPKSAEKIPEDFVMNDFFKEGKTFKPIASDAGLDAGFLTGPAAGASAAGALVDAPLNERRVKLTNPGAEPKAARRYVLKAATEDRRLVISTSVLQEAQGQRQGGDQPPVTVALAFTGKPGAEQRLDVVLKKLTLQMPPNVDKRVALAQEKQLKEIAGLSLGMRLSSRGSLGEPEFEAEKMPPGAQEIVPILAQAFEIVTIPFPEEPVGVGATWEETQMQKDQSGIEVETQTSYVLKDASKDGVLKVDVEMKRRSKKVEVRAKGAPPGTTMEMKGSGKYSYELKLSGVAIKVDGELVTQRIIEVPQGPQKVTQTETSKVKHALDTSKVP